MKVKLMGVVLGTAYSVEWYDGYCDIGGYKGKYKVLEQGFVSFDATAGEFVFYTFDEEDFGMEESHRMKFNEVVK